MGTKTAIAKVVRSLGGDFIVESPRVRAMFGAPIYKRMRANSASPENGLRSGRIVAVANETKENEQKAPVEPKGGMVHAPVSGPKLSVIVPSYNVEEYIAKCLDSVLRQTHTNLEIIVVDDGSTDRTGIIADQYSRNDSRVKVIHKANGGLGAARNTGLRSATGKYVTFIDSDDDIPKTAYKALVSTLERTGSAFASGAISRFNSQKEWTPAWVHEVHSGQRESISAADFPPVLWDLFVCNKVFRRDVWDSLVGSFPEGTLYEDQECTAKLFAAAVKFDLIKDNVYRWRLRDDGSSITQNKSDVNDLRQRISVAETVRPIIESSDDTGLISYWYSKLLCEDLYYYYREVPRAVPEFWDVLCQGVERFYDDESLTLTGWPLGRRLMALAARRRDYQAFESVLMETLERGEQTQLVRGNDGMIRETMPSMATFRSAVPDEVCAVTDEDSIASHAFITRIEYAPDGLLRLDGVVYYDGMTPSKERQLEAKLVDGSAASIAEFELEVRADSRDDETADSFTGNPFVSAAAGGFTVTVTPQDISTIASHYGSTETPLLKLYVRLDEHGLDRWVPVTRVVSMASRNTLHVGPFTTDGHRALPASDGAEYGVKVLSPRFRARQLQLSSNGALELALELNNRSPESLARRFDGNELYAEAVIDGEVVASQRLTLSREGSHQLWRGVLQLSTRRAYAAQNLVWIDMRVRTTGGAVAPIAADSGGLAAQLAGVFCTEATGYGYLRVAYINQAADVSDVSFDACSGRLTICGRAQINDRSVRQTTPSFALVGKSRNVLPVGMKYDQLSSNYEVTFELLELDIDGRRTAVPAQNYVFEILTATGRKLPASMWPRRTMELADRLPIRYYGGTYRVIVQPVQNNGVSVNVGSRFTWNESGPYSQRRLSEMNFSVLNRKVEDAVLFESFGGRAVTDTPKALDAYVASKRTDLKRYWTVRDGSVAVPEGTTPVTLYSEEWYRAASRSLYLVNNNNFPFSFRKAPEQIYVQTWHGTPLKRIGNDVPSANLSLSYRRLMLREARYWNWLIAQSRWAAPVLSHAFGYEGDVVIEGYPRNDSLLQGRASDERRDRVRRYLGIPDGQLAILYAPTWRDNRRAANGHYAQTLFLDYSKVRNALGDSAVVLQRGHVNTAYAQGGTYGPNVIDVNSYADVNDLYLAADVLITDYSSVMFDFVTTGKPIMFLAPDLAMYRDVTRGFYFDFERSAPGPILSTTAECIDYLRSLPEMAARYDGAYGRFVHRYAPFDDGHAAERVGRIVFGEK
ncbi:MAG: bifunctional glycosyltransferase family 2 protein/CDP-glycerol:glycerophosphate glycerophosphotransferase [Actinomyces succiniciruminis]|nr:bifunctional glycosyltransferase family 2 protein/CDP-glycerol:glycerophosphate glycerophosphotransferase [Actinomyces succiniciruminis]